MAQSLAQLEAALDAQLETISYSGNLIGSTPLPHVKENTASNYSMQPDTTSLMAVRTTLIPAKTTKETVGLDGYLWFKGMYVCDVIGTQNTGTAAARALGDAIMAGFPSGLILTLPNTTTVTIDVASPSVQIAQGGRLMGKVFLTQVIVEYFGYCQP